MPFKQVSRNPRSGFSLLEAMLALAILGLVLGSVYTMAIRGVHHQVDAKQRYYSAAMARAILDEYTTTYPNMPQSGIYKGVWNWSIVEAKERPEGSTEFDRFFDFFRLTARVTHISRGSAPYELFTVIARRAEGI